MKDETVTDALLREFLLGRLADTDRERLEGLFLTDSQIRDRVLALEQELIDDYLEDSLSGEERARFVSRYARTDEQRRMLRINSAIRDWAIREAATPHPVTSTASVWGRFWTWVRLRPRYMVPIAVTIVIAVMLAIVWLNSRMEQRKHLAIEQELAHLNSPANLREVPPQMTSFALRPIVVRSVDAQVQLKIPVGFRLIELQLPWIQKERYSTYRAELRRVGDPEAFTIPNLQVENTDLSTIRLRIPAQMLVTGDYTLKLIGIAAHGVENSTEEYSFVVVN